MKIEVENLNVHLTNKHILKDITFSVNQNEFVAILGKSGCGKTVLLKTLLGNFNFSGSIFIDGQNIRNKSTLIGNAFQDFFILPWLTLRQNIELVSNNFYKIKYYADAMGITKHLDSFPKHVSKGTCQRASIIRALVTQSDIMFMDEPLCSVDFITAEEIRKELKTVCENKTVIFVTHDINEALFLADRIICIRDGQISLDAPTINLSKDVLLTHLKTHD